MWYIADTTGAAGFGHGALLVGPVTYKGKNDQYLYLSVNFDKGRVSKDAYKVLPGQGGYPVKLDITAFDSVEKAVASKELQRYGWWVKVGVDPKTTQSTLDELEPLWQKAQYRLLLKNCSDLPYDFIERAQKQVKHPLFPGPNVRAQNIDSLVDKGEVFRRKGNAELEKVTGNIALQFQLQKLKDQLHKIETAFDNAFGLFQKGAAAIDWFTSKIEGLLPFP